MEMKSSQAIGRHDDLKGHIRKTELETDKRADTMKR
jgi:hypothetical protein